MKRLLWAGALVFLAGCGTPAKLNYFTLGLQPGGAPASAVSRPLTIYVGPVTIPEAVDRPQMVTRIATNQVEIAELDRWAEPLKAAIPRVVSEALSRALATSTVMTSRQSATLTFDYRVAIDVQRFDFSAGDGAVVDALWTIRTAKDGPPRTGRTEARERSAGGGPQSMAAAQSRAVEKVAGDIAAAIGSLERP
jgi:uncharacterized lipoprotein YmbA